MTNPKVFKQNTIKDDLMDYIKVNCHIRFDAKQHKDPFTCGENGTWRTKHLIDSDPLAFTSMGRRMVLSVLANQIEQYFGFQHVCCETNDNFLGLVIAQHYNCSLFPSMEEEDNEEPELNSRPFPPKHSPIALLVGTLYTGEEVVRMLKSCESNKLIVSCVIVVVDLTSRTELNSILNGKGIKYYSLMTASDLGFEATIPPPGFASLLKVTNNNNPPIQKSSVITDKSEGDIEEAELQIAKEDSKVINTAAEVEVEEAELAEEESSKAATTEG